jgi:hypothetical protein
MTIVTGAIKFIDVPNDFCITTITELIKFVQKHGAVEFNASEITNIYVGTSQPTDTSVVWFQISPSGNFIGVYVYAQSQWLPVFPPPNQVIRMYGDSANVPLGYELITSTTPGFSLAMVTFLQAQWMPNPSSPSDYVIFDVVYVGV